MAFRVSGKNMDIGDALRTRIVDRLDEALQKYFDGSATGHVIVERDGSGFRTDCVLHLSSGTTVHAEGSAHEAYASADAAAGHVEKRLRRYKRRLKDHYLGRSTALDVPAASSYVIQQPPDDELPHDDVYHPVIIAESTTGLKALSVAEAVMDLDLTGAPVLVFRHAEHGRINVVYRRSDGNIGWIDPPGAPAAS
jgi:ribosomal subunit interface protein